MSSKLKENILGVGQLQQQIYAVLVSLAELNSAGAESSPTNPADAQRQLAEKLADAVADGVAKGVQAYLVQLVVTDSMPGPVSHIHKIIAP